MILKDTGRGYAETAEQICNDNDTVESMRTHSIGTTGLSFCKTPYIVTMMELTSGIGCLRRFEWGKTIALELFGG
jgi:hypothetical protein